MTETGSVWRVCAIGRSLRKSSYDRVILNAAKNWPRANSRLSSSTELAMSLCSIRTSKLTETRRELRR